MKLEKLVGDRFKERPADCVIDSHALMEKVDTTNMWQMVSILHSCH